VCCIDLLNPPEKAVIWREIYLSVDDPDERQPSCGLHAGDYKGDLSAPSPRTRFAVRAVRK